MTYILFLARAGCKKRRRPPKKPYPKDKLAKFKKYVDNVYNLAPRIIHNWHTNVNESMNNIRTKFVSKRHNCAATYATRADMALLQKNEGEEVWRVAIFNSLQIPVSSYTALRVQRELKAAKRDAKRKADPKYIKGRLKMKQKRSGKEPQHVTASGVVGTYTTSSSKDSFYGQM